MCAFGRHDYLWEDILSVAIITGSAGLVGSEAVRYFAALGMDVVGIDNGMRAKFFGEEASTTRVRDELVQDLPQYLHYDVDIRDTEESRGFLRALAGRFR